VCFYDRQHGQTGRSKNGIELHPILALKFGTDAPEPPGPMTATASVKSLTIHQAAERVLTVIVAPPGDANEVYTVEGVTLPEGVTIESQEQSITPQGTRAILLGIKAAADAPKHSVNSKIKVRNHASEEAVLALKIIVKP
jgi:hypothetical protein